MLPLVTLMLTVPTLLGASPVHVTMDTLEMEPLVKVRTQLEPYFSQYPHMSDMSPHAFKKNYQVGQQHTRR